MSDYADVEVKKKLKWYWLYLPDGNVDGDFTFFNFNVYNWLVLEDTDIFNILLEINVHAVARFTPDPVYSR